LGRWVHVGQLIRIRMTHTVANKVLDCSCGLDEPVRAKRLDRRADKRCRFESHQCHQKRADLPYCTRRLILSPSGHQRGFSSSIGERRSGVSFYPNWRQGLKTPAGAYRGGIVTHMGKDLLRASFAHAHRAVPEGELPWSPSLHRNESLGCDRFRTVVGRIKANARLCRHDHATLSALCGTDGQDE